MVNKLVPIMLTIGFIIGIIYAVGGLFYDFFTTGGVNWGTALAFLAIIGMPLIFGIFGYVVGVTIDFFINLFMR